MQKKILPIILLLLIVTSCDKMLDVKPIDELTEKDFWKTEADVNAAVISCYTSLKRCQYNMILWSVIRSDVVSYGYKVKNCKDIQKGIVMPEYSINDWKNFYKLINNANIVIAKAEKVLTVDADFSKEDLNHYLSEAYYMRALAYFYLVRVFKEVPLVTEPSDSDKQEYYLPKNTSAEILAQIEKDLIFASQNGAEHFNTDEETHSRVTKDAAKALLSDIYLWQNKYEECVKICNEVLANTQHKLISGDLWFSLFTEGNKSEILFELNYSKKYNETNHFQQWFNPYGNTFVVNKNVADMFDPNDIRLDATIGGPRQNAVWKYVGTALEEKNYNTKDYRNWIVHRLPAVMLNKAEALNRTAERSTKLDEIIGILETLNQRVGTYFQLSGSNDMQSLELDILRERFRELSFEGNRWFDLVRISLRQHNEDKMPIEQTVLIEKIIETKGDTEKLYVKGNIIDPESWFLPIYKKEIERNSKLVQNPYYENL